VPITVIDALLFSIAAGMDNAAGPTGALLISVAAAGLADSDGAATAAAGGRAPAKATGALSFSVAAGSTDSAGPPGGLLISVAAAGLADAAGIPVGSSAAGISVASSSAVPLREDWRATPLGALASSVELASGVDLSSALIDLGAEAAGRGAVERSVPFVVRGPSTWVSVRVSAAAIPDPPVKAAPANAAPTPRPTAPTPSQE
jgi:hypothetical protein